MVGFLPMFGCHLLPGPNLDVHGTPETKGRDGVHRPQVTPRVRASVERWVLSAAKRTPRGGARGVARGGARVRVASCGAGVSEVESSQELG